MAQTVTRTMPAMNLFMAKSIRRTGTAESTLSIIDRSVTGQVSALIVGSAPFDSQDTPKSTSSRELADARKLPTHVEKAWR
jgi:hypothetical protein